MQPTRGRAMAVRHLNTTAESELPGPFGAIREPVGAGTKLRISDAQPAQPAMPGEDRPPLYRCSKAGATVREGVELSSTKVGRLAGRSIVGISEERTTEDGVARARQTAERTHPREGGSQVGPQTHGRGQSTAAAAAHGRSGGPPG